MLPYYMVHAMAVVCIALNSEALQVGQRANNDTDCVTFLNRTICNKIYLPVCAQLGDDYVNGSNVCNFCSKYGDTEAIILQIGIKTDREFRCEPLQVGTYTLDDPKCVAFYGRSACTKEYFPICATADHFRTYIEGSNICDFCSKYGNISALVFSTGITVNESFMCTPLHNGTKANADPGCRYLADNPQRICSSELNPVCADLNDTVLEGGNKCAFCIQYGNSDADIINCTHQ